MKKVELLAPAGNYESFLGAIHAGADAVYFAGTKFGARAYADNFSTEEGIRAIHYAHLMNRKAYLTVNILLKDAELSELYEYILPYYTCGLDGVIVQDLGVFSFLKAHFPKLSLHASTQMTLTGVYGAALLKEMGAARIVPARELSLEEIREIKKQVPIEIEAFIHGAECYCYSGACLFSSILGGRSGNRGRCAQPCRLPYEAAFTRDRTTGKLAKITKEAQYLLSLKDMCTLEVLPLFIEAGIDSFKIEGRMKKPEYAAGVTALYRKYIDNYYENPEKYKVEEADLRKIRKLYIRSEIQNGYYKKHNGREMVTITKPGYLPTEDTLLQSIREQYLTYPLKREVLCRVILKTGAPLQCEIEDVLTGKKVFVEGASVEMAQNRPVEEENVRKQMCKTGSGPFCVKELIVSLDNQAFVPLKALNEVRRNALEKMEETLLQEFLNERDLQESIIRVFPSEKDLQKNIPSRKKIENETSQEQAYSLEVTVHTKEQLQTALPHKDIATVFIDTDLFFQTPEDSYEKVLKKACYYEELVKNAGKSPGIALPYILRKRSYGYFAVLKQILKKSAVKKILLRNLEELSWAQDMAGEKELISDAGIYSFNREAQKFLQQYVQRQTIPLELNFQELKLLGIENYVVPLYSRIPMMITANCVGKTTIGCQFHKKEKDENVILIDRYRKQFLVEMNCLHCYNVIWNGQPVSLHGYIRLLLERKVQSFRLDFTTECAKDADSIITYFEESLRHEDKKNEPPYKEYTKGHFGRGVE